MNNLQKNWIKQVEETIRVAVTQIPDHQKKMKEAMNYAISTGGKRIRPIFLLAGVQLVGLDPQKALPLAAALEMIHTYSLIHDDLPGMDNDVLRRGKPTLHVAYDQATAILAGDAFLTLAFEVGATADFDSARVLSCLQELSRAAGPSGMVAGQVLDIEAEAATISFERLRTIHLLKTGKLLSYALEVGILLADLPDVFANPIRSFAVHYGLAFQIHNDLQDVLWDSSKTGKETGQDMKLEKNTYPHLLTIDGAIQSLNEERSLARESLLQLRDLTSEQEEARNLLIDALAYLEI